MQVFNSMSELGKAYGVSQKPKKEKPFFCRKCGEVMQHIPGTNVYLCNHVFEETAEDGTVKQRPCGNRVLTKYVT